MKIKKEQLKALIKECLVEILAEGLGSEALVEARKPRQVRRKTNTRSLNDSPKPSQALRQAVMESAGGNKVMQSILADTAQTTLPTMISGEGSNAVEHISTPQEVFGEENAGENGKWASLAFASSGARNGVVPPSLPTPKVPDHILDAPVKS